jgi:two-component system sensor kinase
MIPLTALVVIICAVAAWWGSRRISRPLREVTDAAEGLAAGDMRHRVRANGPDEVQRLARSFNTMADRIAISYQDLEKQVAERTRALETTNAELESFSYSVSHDLRAPLRAIHGFSRILLEDHKAELVPEAQRLLGVIDQNTRRMGQLIDDLLSFSRLGRQELTASPVDMQDMAATAADEVRRGEGERRIEIAVAALPPARGDRSLLRQVVNNLLQNAAKFTRGTADAHIEVGYSANGDGYNVYFVKDNGAGFDQRYAGKLFGVFQRLHSADEFDGTGVGLAIVKRIVQRHGGRVWAEGTVNGGATFYFTLPASDGDE